MGTWYTNELDRRILDILRRDVRTPNTEIAAEVRTSERTVRNRIERLVEEGVIERFTISTRTGSLKAMIEVTVAVDVDTNDVSELMADWKDVDFVWQVPGEEDIVLVVDAANTHAVNDLITHAREHGNVKNTKARLILDGRLG